MESGQDRIEQKRVVVIDRALRYGFMTVMWKGKRTLFRFLTSLLCLTLLLIPSFASLQAQEEVTQEPAAGPTYRTVGYFASWSIFERGYFVTDIPAEMLTHLNYAFAFISADGEIMLADEWADTQYPYPDDSRDQELLGNFHQLQLLKEAHPNLQTSIAIGGWTGSANFSDAALTPESREKFARSVVEFMLRYGFDGADIDWEYPTGGGLGTNIRREEDPDNFVLLLEELRAQFDAQERLDEHHYTLTIAAAASPSINGRLDWDRLHPLLDWINVMTYDMSGEWSTVTGFNAPLYDSQENPPESISIDTALNALLDLDVPPEKLVVGVPFYGRGWAEVLEDNDGLHQPFNGLPIGTFSPGTFDYSDLASNYLASYERHWHDVAQVPWLYNSETDIMITYDDPESIGLKAEYVREHGLGGIMFWEISQDSDDAALLTAIYETLNAP
jgi:chitinase